MATENKGVNVTLIKASEITRGYSPRQRMTPREQMQRVIAEYRTTTAIRKGMLVRPVVCSKCGGTVGGIQAHHKDYSKPLEVEWLCKRCHYAVHGQVLKDKGIKG